MKVKILGLTLLLLLINFYSLFAQGVPCDDPDDPACNSPLDAWVLILVGIFLIYTTLKLYQKKKLQKAI